MSYHVIQTTFKELPKRIIVREDGYMDAHKQESIPITGYVYVLHPAMNTGMLSNPADELREAAVICNLAGEHETARLLREAVYTMRMGKAEGGRTSDDRRPNDRKETACQSKRRLHYLQWMGR